MPADRDVHVHLLPSLAAPGALAGGLAVVIDVLRATTTILHALAAGCKEVRPVADLDEARKLVDSLPAGRSLLCGERGGLPPPGFDLGNSPREFTAKSCKGATLVFTTTNGTAAIARAAEAERVLAAAFVNLSAVCEAVVADTRPLQIVCAGMEGTPALEDTLLAGAIVDCVSEAMEADLNDSARLAWDCFENHGQVLREALALSAGGRHLKALGLEHDIAAAAEVDKVNIIAELRRDPLRFEISGLGRGRHASRGPV
jgi:2-phosphosulfolactate phosphatase